MSTSTDLRLTGAVDVVAVKHEDGTYSASPFHIRFGKMGVIRSFGKPVYIQVNGQQVDLHMKLGEGGEAFFHDDDTVELETKNGDEGAFSEPKIHLRGDVSKVKVDEIKKEILKPKRRRKRRKISRVHVTNGNYSEGDSDFHVNYYYSSDSSRMKNSDVMIDAKEIPLLYFLSRWQSETSLQESEHLFNQAKRILKRKAISELSLLDRGLYEHTESSTVSKGISSSILPDSSASEGLQQAISFIRRMHKEIATISFHTSVHGSDLSDSSESTKARFIKYPNTIKPPVHFSPKSDTEYECVKSNSHSANRSNLTNVDRSEKPIDPKASEGSRVYRLLSPLFGGRKTDVEGELYLDEVIDRSYQDPELTSIYLNSLNKDDDRESGNGASLSSHSPPTEIDIVSSLLGTVCLSDCGGLDEGITEELFNKHLVTEETFRSNPYILFSPKVVFKIDGRFYNWQTAAPLIIAAVAFHTVLPQKMIDGLISNFMPKKRENPTKPKSARWWIFSRQRNEANVETGSAPDAELSTAPPSAKDTTEKKKNIKSERRLHLRSEELAKLNLCYGSNEISFSVTTPLQGTAVINSYIYLFHENDKFIISDIDGTITRSDVIGQILPLVGKDWSHDGITEFFNAIYDNGYKFIYLSARAIGQSAITRDYLRNLKQRGYHLPSGPLLLSPDSLFSAFYREVIAKKPEEFKIQCLKDILNLFPASKNPFYAGFGNRVNDQWAYTAVGVPLQRIFTIDTTGVVKLHASDYSSYRNLHEIVDQIFPPVGSNCSTVSFYMPQDFSSFSFWRDEICKLPDC